MPSEQMVNALAYIEQTYWESGSIPTTEKIAEVAKCTVESVDKWFKNDKFREALHKRGVSLAAPEDIPILSFEQLNTVTIMLNTYDKRSMREKLEEVGVTSQQLNAWMRDPKFAEHVRKRAEQKFQAADATAYMTVLKNMESGDLNATRLFLEMRNIYNPKVQVEVNVDLVLTRIIEIVATHVKDPAILAAIADDIDRIGEAPSRRELAPVDSTAQLVKATSLDL